MRKVILQMSMTLDGKVSGPDGKMDWVFSASTQTTRDYIDGLLNGSDHILLGRGMAKGFLDYWPTDKTEFGAKINRLPKTVFSKTWDKAEWPDVTIAVDIASEIAKLKAQPGKNIILYGGAGLAQSFMNLNLIDEYHLLVFPLILGPGLSLFDKVEDNVKLTLVKTTTSESGVVVFHYEPKKAA